jgi:hypothetical protein
MYGHSAFDVMVQSAVARRSEEIRQAAWEAGFRAGLRVNRLFGMLIGGATVAAGFFIYVWLAQ